MRRLKLVPAFVLILGSSLMAWGDDEPKKDAGANPRKADDGKTVLAEFVGKVKSVSEKDQSFNLEITYQYLAPRQSAVFLSPSPKVLSLARMQEHMVTAQQSIDRSRNPLQFLVRINHLQNLMAKAEAEMVLLRLPAGQLPFQMASASKEVEFQTPKDVQVRRVQLPEKKDENGKVQKYTSAELKELKGKNPDVPGYAAAFGDVKKGQTLKVSVALPADKDKDKEKDKDKSKSHPAPAKVEATRLVILHGDGKTDAAAANKK